MMSILLRILGHGNDQRRAGMVQEMVVSGAVDKNGGPVGAVVEEEYDSCVGKSDLSL